MSIEAMKQALEAYCKTLNPLWNTGISRTEAEGFFEAGFKASIAEAEKPEPVAMKFKIYKPTVPDPMRQDINDALLPWVYDQSRDSGFVASMWVTPVSTLPPQRTWVGLTQDELNMIGDSMRTWNSWTITDVYFAIEAKLKEKNT